MQADAQSVVLNKLRELTAHPDRLRGGATEIYYDARVSGDDLWELVTYLADRFGTDFSAMDLRLYAPGEGAQLVRPLLMFFGRRPYRSLTVETLTAAVQQGYWLEI
jgi:hypothetical protein